MSISQEPNVELHKPALNALKDQIRTSTSSMTSIPKAMKFLQPHYGTLKEIFELFKSGEEKVICRGKKGKKASVLLMPSFFYSGHAC